MNAGALWQKLREDLRPGSPSRDSGLRRVGLRLVLQTVGLLLVMLVALEGIVFLITQQSLLHSLETTLRVRANPPQAFIHRIYHPQGQIGTGDIVRRQFRDPRRSEASVVYLDTHLRPIGHGSGYLGGRVIDAAATRMSLETLKTQCCSQRPYAGTTFLVYTTVLRDGGKVVGVAQASIATDQYQQTLLSLLQALVAVSLMGLVVSGIIGTMLARRALKPVSDALLQQRDFVSGAAHELRTPLTVMRTIGEVRLKDAATEDEQTALIQMLAQNSHLTQLVDDLSLLARGDSQALPIDRDPVDLSTLIAETAEEVEPLASLQEVHLTTETNGSVQILGDALRMRQLLLILLDNALKHTPADGEIRVILGIAGGRARLRVLDSGPGIAPEHLPRIFDRFYRADPSRTGEGSGLGLAIAQWIVGTHGGQIQAENMPRGGAAFTVTLPLLRSDGHSPQRTAASQSVAH